MANINSQKKRIRQDSKRNVRNKSLKSELKTTLKILENEEVTSEQLGGSEIHTTVSSVADGAYENDLEMMEQIRELIDFLPSSNISQAPIKNTDDPIDRVEDSLDTLVPDNSNTPYDIKELILKVIDENDFFEIQEKFAQNIVTGFGRFDAVSYTHLTLPTILLV